MGTHETTTKMENMNTSTILTSDPVPLGTLPHIPTHPQGSPQENTTSSVTVG